MNTKQAVGGRVVAMRTTFAQFQSAGLEEACNAFLSRCVALNLAEGTVGWYARLLRELRESLASSGVSVLEAVRPSHLRDHLARLRAGGQGSVTISKTYGALRCVFKFWYGDGLIASNPMALVERPRQERTLIRPFSKEQVPRLLDQPGKKTILGLRDRAMMMFMLDCGPRVSEVVTLQADKIDWPACRLTVMGKGRKERSLPFSAATCRAFLEYARLRAKLRNPAPEFFLGRTGRGLGRSRVRRIVVGYARRAGIKGMRASPHTLRHTFAVLYVRNGGDPFSLQQLLGHTTLDMSRNYVNLARTDVEEQHKKFSPMASLESIC